MFARTLFIYAVCLGVLMAYASYWTMQAYAGNHGPFFGTEIDRLYHHALGSWLSVLVVAPLLISTGLKVYAGMWPQATFYAIYAAGLFFVLQTILPLLFD